MQFPAPLITGRLVRRYKRFLADVVLDRDDHGAGKGGGEDNDAVTVHVPNSGAMLGLAVPGMRVWLSRAAGAHRKLPFTWELVEADGTLVGVNTQHPNGLAAAALRAGRIPELAGYARLRREVNYGRASRVDILLEDDGRPPVFVEVKNVHLRRPGLGDGRAAEFPDCVTARGARHLEELADQVAQGARAVMLYLVQRSDCAYFRIAGDLDPAYRDGLRRARAAGVEVLCWTCAITPERIELDRPLPLRLTE
jgi:sugar fermentation stimulation protein A